MVKTKNKMPPGKFLVHSIALAKTLVIVVTHAGLTCHLKPSKLTRAVHAQHFVAAEKASRCSGRRVKGSCLGLFGPVSSFHSQLRVLAERCLRIVSSI